jgi:hypothetical protein
MFLTQFKAQVTSLYNLPGLVSLHHSDKELTDPWAFLGDILLSDNTLVVRYDKTISVANGGLSLGGRATAANGRTAFAAGGRSMGGQRGADGTMRGGAAFGGMARGDQGAGGAAMGGGANNIDGEARSGLDLGGIFITAKVDGE